MRTWPPPGASEAVAGLVNTAIDRYAVVLRPTTIKGSAMP